MTGGDTERMPLPPLRAPEVEADDDPTPEDRESHLIALIIAVGLAGAVILITFAVAWDSIGGNGGGLTDNATQVLAGAFGGMIGILGSVLGYRAGASSHQGGE